MPEPYRFVIQITFLISQIWIVIKECKNVSNPVTSILETFFDNSVQKIKNKNIRNEITHQSFEMSTYYLQKKEHWKILQINDSLLTAIISPIITTILTLIQFELTFDDELRNRKYS
ncbi:CLUMA_CG006217, isoform A [Clunio marinus]|uniref:CLUMA_CG006217, isoform A n=1 Tax=Clunio marinus TaxID=568069 RepID=A0A1J1I2P0_9DIPT|nr:CLUMA_CG006217, isoform A [Clunio marinus]